MNTSDSESSFDTSRYSSASESIDLVVEFTLERMQRGEEVNLDEIIRDHPNLQPDLASRLRTLRQVFQLMQENSASVTESSPITQNGSNRFRTPEIQVRLECPHCGAGIKVLEQNDEVTCRNCGSSIQITPRDRPPRIGAFTERLQQLGRFSLREIVGRGGFGIVYRAFDTELARVVAIKLPREGTFETPEDEQRFLREARHVAQLSHPHIVPVYEVGRTDESPYIVSEFIDGMTLGDLINNRRLGFRQAAELMAKIADAVAYAHEKKIIHRDLKPGNILLNHELDPYVADFGLARAEDANEFTITMDGQVIGTPSYMSPEQVKGESTRIGSPSDIYSLGVIFYRMLTGDLPFRGSKRLMLHQIQYEEPRSPRALNEFIPRDYDTIALKAMAKEPGKRYASAAALAEDLRNAIAGRPIKARPVSRPEKFWRLCRRYPLASSLACALAITLVLATISGFVFGARESGLRRSVETEKTRALFQQARGLVAQGNRYVVRGDNIGGLPWQSKAFEVEAENQELQSTYRLGLGTLLAHCPRLNSVQAKSVSINAAALSADDRFAAAGYRDGTVRVWEIQADRLLVESSQQDQITDIAFSGDNRWVAASGNDGSILVWDLQTGNLTFSSTDQKDRIHQIAFNRAGTAIASASRDTNARIWKFQESSEQVVFPHDLYVTEVAFGNDDQTLVTVEAKIVTEESTVRFWDVESPRNPITSFEYPSQIYQLQANSAGTHFAGRSYNGQVLVWSVENGQPETLSETSEFSHIVHLQFVGPESRQLGLVDSQGTIRVIDMESATVQKQLETGTFVGAAAFQQAGQQVAVANRIGQAFVWDIDQQSTVASPLWHAFAITGLEFTENGKHLLTAGKGGFAKVWDIATEHQATRVIENPGEHWHGNISNSGKQIAFTDDPQYKKLTVLSLEDFQKTTFELPDQAGDLGFSPDDSELIVACQDGTARIYATDNGQLLSDVIKLGDNQFDLVRYCRLGTRVLATDQVEMTGPVRLRYHNSIHLIVWDRASGEELWRQPHDNRIAAIEVSPDNRFVATTCYDQSCRVFDLESGQVITGRLHDQQGYVSDCRFSSDSSRLVTACTKINQTVLWDFVAGRKVGEPIQHFAAPEFARFHPTYGTLVVATDDGVVRFRDREPPDSPSSLRAFATRFNQMQFSQDNRLLLTSTTNPQTRSANQRLNQGAVQLWNLATLEMTGPLFSSSETIWRSLFDPHGHSVVAVSRQGRITIWKLVSDHRPVSVINDLASVLSGHVIQNSNLVPLSAEEFLQRWERVKNRHPETSPSEYSVADGEETGTDRN